MDMNERYNNARVFENYPQALDALVARLRAREFDPDEYHIVLTPDRYTQSVERALFSGSGAIDLEVLTLSRLSRRIAPDGGKALSREGGVMLVAQSVSAVQSKLTYYKRAAKYTDFAREVYDTMQQLCASVADAGRLDAPHNATRSKLADLAEIRAEYVRRKGDHVDSPDRLIELIAAVPDSEFVKNSHFYAIGYSLGYDTTRLNRRVFDTIAAHARSFEYYEAKPPEDVRDELSLFGAPDKASQYKEVAVRICDHVRRGGSFEDIAVVCPEPRTLARILREYEIDFYHDESVPLYSTPVISAVENLYKLRTAVVENCPIDGQALVALCKNPFSGCDDDDAQVLQNKLTSRGRFLLIDTDFKNEAANRAAARARELVAKFDGDFSAAVRAVAEYAEFEEIQKTVFEGCTDTVAPMLSLVELLERYGSKDFDADAKSYFSAARAVEIKSVPRYKNRVIVTMPNSLRLERCKLLFITDFNEGSLPIAMSDNGLLCDDEINAINELCSPERIEPTVREQNRRERVELAAAVRNAGEVFCTYITSGRPAAFVYELAADVKKPAHSECMATLKQTDDPQTIARYACVTAAAREAAARKLTKHARSLVAAVGECEHKAAEFTPVIACAEKKSVSVSELTNYFKCPYKRFLHDGVGLADRRSSALDAPDFGIIMHDFMCALVNEGMETGSYDLSAAHIKELVDDAIAEKELFIEPQAYARLVADAAEYAAINVKILRSGVYKPLRNEIRFDGKTLGARHTEFTGKIDRIDVCGGDVDELRDLYTAIGADGIAAPGIKLRIIDYKTGSTEFKLKNCYNGTDMQLPLYAYAVGAERVTGFFYVKLAQRYESKKPMNGRLIEEVDIALDYDDALENMTPSEIMSIRLSVDKKTGDRKFNGTYKTQMPRDDFAALIDRCVQTAGGGADEIAEGYIERTPIDGTCENCRYFGVCGERRVFRGNGDDDASEEE